MEKKPIDIDRMVVVVTVVWLGYHFLGRDYLWVAIPAIVLWILEIILGAVKK